MDGVRLRAMTVDDAAPLSEAFARIGWHKPVELYQRYLAETSTGVRVCVVAEVAGELAGYVTLLWTSDYPPFREAGVPEVCDLNVLPHLRRRGVGAALLGAVEDAAGRRGGTVGLGVGLHPGYGAAQRLYTARGYLPDGRGAVRDHRPVAEGATVPLDDDTCLMLTRALGAHHP
ncbi:GNAT family N-acetyltransferase [Auraticoccus monumenti]|uniref:Ribosomal protein S18 acetylase RimI n=1 Tax=Auraticoccus monumenti TaxID=675864 RepID=A0A1G6SK76_9ACTN|nr:GNAT family N-acetyltransferase [Auraticoccus monumenti]SDD16577.1 Ribosomal protein S18 acetylase RimI [Auraticoccus monumenti]